MVHRECMVMNMIKGKKNITAESSDFFSSLTRHFYDMSNMMSRNEGVWLSNGWVKVFLWIFLPCFLYTVISIVIFSTRNLHSFEKGIWEVFNNYGEDMPSLSNISPIFSVLWLL